MYPFLKRGARLLFKASGRLSGRLPARAALPGRKFGDSMSRRFVDLEILEKSMFSFLANSNNGDFWRDKTVSLLSRFQKIVFHRRETASRVSSFSP